MQMKLLTLTASALGLLLATTATAARAESCQALASASIPGAKITSASLVEQGSSQEVGAFGIPPLPASRAYCKVQATLTPTPDSEIRAEVWLPSPGEWNGKFLASGNGGFGGSVGPPRLTMRVAVHQGYATAGTDLGHNQDGASGEHADWALNHPEKIVDFGYRANHQTALFAKAVIARYYGAAPRHAYFQGCSDGGREALMEAERFPDDYDGVIAGAPANAWTRLMTSFAWTFKAAHSTPDALIPDAKLPVIQDAVLKQCDLLDGVKDGVIDDPRACHFDPASLACKSGDGPDCLTGGQAEALRQIYQGPRNPRTGASLFPGFPVSGAENAVGWSLWITGPKAQQPSFASSFFANFVFNNPAWTLAQLDFDQGVALAERLMAPILNSDHTDLSAFKARGGKLLIYHGWADPAITPYSTIQFYDGVRGKMGVKAADSFSRLFLAPGVGHCLGGPGPSSFDMLGALEGWVEHGQAPDQVIASKYANDFAGLLDLPQGEATRTRPLCAYPKTARWDGNGSPDLAASYACRAAE